jgi:hypothetical protein
MNYVQVDVEMSLLQKLNMLVNFNQFYDGFKAKTITNAQRHLFRGN